MYSACPLRWKLTYIDKLAPFEKNIYLIFGSAMHTTIQTYLTTLYNTTIREANQLNLYELLQSELITEFNTAKQELDRNPCSKQELYEFFDDGATILDWFLKHREDYFSKQHWKLLGCEMPINVPLKNNLRMVGFLDLVLLHEPTHRIRIIDLKTSTRGWNKYQKKDKNKTSQLLLYKQFYAKQYNHPLDKIDVEFLIMKRKLYDNVDFPQKRFQRFTPAHGKPSMNKVTEALSSFINEAFDDRGNHDILNPFVAQPSKSTCRFCVFLNTEYCTKGIG